MAQIGIWCDMYKAPRKIKAAFLSWSGTPTGATHTYDFSVDSQTESFVTVSSSTDITLGSGAYYAIAYPDYTRAATSTNNEIYWFLDGVQIGKRGGSDHYDGESCDNPETSFVITGSGTLTLRQTAWSGSAITLTSHCKALIMKVEE